MLIKWMIVFVALNVSLDLENPKGFYKCKKNGE